MRRRLFIVFNPSAGVPRGKFFADVVARLEHRGAVVCIVEPQCKSEAEAAVRQASGHHDAIVAAGGDGTIRQVANALGNCDTPIGVIPLGTGNVMAREIGLQRQNAISVADTLLDGPARKVTGALANGSPFYLMAGIGFDGRVIGRLDQILKRGFGRAAFGPAMLGALGQPLDHLEIAIDGRPYEAAWLIVANARHYGGGFVIADKASIFEAGLTAVLIGADSKLDLVRQLIRVARGSLVPSESPRVRLVDCKSIEVRGFRDPAVPAQVDGDSLCTTPLSIDADGPQISLIVPA